MYNEKLSSWNVAASHLSIPVDFVIENMKVCCVAASVALFVLGSHTFKIAVKAYLL